MDSVGTEAGAMGLLVCQPVAQPPVASSARMDCRHHPTQLVPHFGLAASRQLCTGPFAPTLAEN